MANSYEQQAIKNNRVGTGVQVMANTLGHPPIESVSSVLGEVLASVRELNQRLAMSANLISGSIPEPGQLDKKSEREPTLIDTARIIREAVAQAHNHAQRITQGL